MDSGHVSSSKDKDPSDPILKFLAIAATVVSVIVLVWPFIANSGIIKAHDILVHMSDSRAFLKAFLEGQFPVRMIDDPRFNFYPPGFNYLFVGTKLFGFANWEAFRIVTVLLWLGSGVFTYLFSKKYFGVLGGLLAALLFVFAPYRAELYYVRAAMSEFTALSFVPAVLWSIQKVWENGRGIYFFLLSFVFSLFLISHAITIIIFLPLFIAYVLYLFFKNNKRESFVKTGAALLLGLGIAAFYLLPSFGEIKLTHTSQEPGINNYSEYFVCPKQLFVPSWGYGATVAGCDDGLSFQVGVIHWLLLFVVIGYMVRNLILNRKTGDNNNLFIFLFMCFLALSIFMMLGVSSIVWKTVPYTTYIQFPWRYLGLAAFSASIIGGSVITIIKSQSGKHLLFLGAAFAVLILYSSYLKPAYYIDESLINYNNENFLKGLEKELEGFLEGGLSSFSYKDIDAAPKRSEIPQSGLEVKQGAAIVSSSDQKYNNKKYQLNLDRDSVILFYTRFFPGWQVYMDGQKTPFSYKNEYGFIDVNVPKGSHEVILSFEDTPIRKIGNFISAASFFTALFVAFFMERNARRRNC